MWPRIFNAALGIWLMAAPAVLGYGGGAAATNGRIVGPVAASFAIIAVWGATRGMRRANFALGVWLILAPLVLGYAAVPAVNSVIVGVLMAGISFIKGPVKERFDGGWMMLWGSGATGSGEMNG